MKGKRIFLSLVLVLSMVFAMAFTASATENPNVIIRNLLNYYRYYESDSLTDVYRLLDELEAIDPAKADNWRKIMDRWDYAVNDLRVPFGCLPDGLPEDDSLCILVMGYVLNPDGTMRDELVGRCQVALNSHKKYPHAYIICTGGGTASGNSQATEAGQMAKWLIAHGVDESRVIVEKRSLSSEHNAMYSMAILQEQYPHVDSIALISSDYHVRRCFVLFESALALNDWDEDYEIVATAGYDSKKTGDEGPKIEAESIGLMLDLYVSGMSKPTLSVLEGILVSGATEYLSGDMPQLTVTALYNNDFSRDVSGKVVYEGYDPALIGEQDVTVQYTENGVTATSAVKIIVTPAPTETTLPPTEETQPEVQTDPEPAESAEVIVQAETKEDSKLPPVWILLVPILAAITLTIKVVEMVQRKRRRRRRPRKQMEWE